MKFFKIFSFCIFLLSSFEVRAQDPSLIIQKIALGNGKVSKAEYDQFWQSMNINKREDKKRIIDSMRVNFVLMQEYQKEIWICAEQAWVARSIPKCEKAQKKIAEIKSQLGGQASILKNTEDSFGRLLQAAAKREDFRINDNAASLSLKDVATIRTTRINLEKMLGRFEQVLRLDY